MGYQSILFDLDGTITDSAPGIIRSLVATLSNIGITVDDPFMTLRPFLGPPLKTALMEILNLGEKQAETAVKFYRKYYAQHGIFDSHVYPGMSELLQKLHSSGKEVLLATSKPILFAERILEHFSLAPYFSFIGGADFKGKRKDKSDVVSYVLKKSSFGDPAKTIMIGDRKHDVIGAANNGIGCIGVLYGYGTKEELQAAGAISIAETVEDLARILL